MAEKTWTAGEVRRVLAALGATTTDALDWGVEQGDTDASYKMGYNAALGAVAVAFGVARERGDLPETGRVSWVDLFGVPVPE